MMRQTISVNQNKWIKLSTFSNIQLQLRLNGDWRCQWGKKDVKITFWSSNNQKFINWMRKPATIMSEWVRAFNFNCTSAMKWSRKFKAENNGASFYSMRLLLLLRPVYLLFRSTLCSEPVIKNGNAIGIE